MLKNIKVPYVAAFISSILLYWIPYEIGGSVLRWVLALVTATLFLYTLREVVRTVPKGDRSSIALWQTNGLALLHLVLIYISLTFTPSITLISGMILSGLLYLFVEYRVKQIL